MKKKHWITAGLLLFVAVAVAALVVKETRTVVDQPETSAVAPAEAAAAPAVNTATVMAYYFHGTARCMSCKTIERLTNESIQNNFASQLKSGALQWKVINVEEGDNRHYAGDYKLYTKSVVLSRMENGTEKRWKNLEEVWNRLGDEDGFKRYIKTEIEGFLNQKG